ncbi:MAG: penicillin acylase family protein [Bacteroidetes bacterium]|nr:penicillin acylase family protein [Bacteroidota bacterium]
MIRKTFLLASGFLLAGFVFILWFFSRLTSGAVTDWSGEKLVFGLTGQTEVLRDSSGFATISAQTSPDFAFSLGYIHAQDRLWQLFWLREEMQGKTAAYIGKSGLGWDLLARILGFGQRAEKLVDQLPESEKIYLQAYCKGVNEFIRLNPDHLPPEFSILNCDPGVWKPEHSVGILLLLKWRFLVPQVKTELLNIVLSQPGYSAFKEILLPGLPNTERVSDGINLVPAGGNYSLPDWLKTENGWSVSLSAFGNGLTGNNSPVLRLSFKDKNHLPAGFYPVFRSGTTSGLFLGFPGTPWFFAGISDKEVWFLDGFRDTLSAGIVQVHRKALRNPVTVEVKDGSPADFLIPDISSVILLPSELSGFSNDSVQFYIRGIDFNLSGQVGRLLAEFPETKTSQDSATVKITRFSCESEFLKTWSNKVIFEKDTLSIPDLEQRAGSVQSNLTLFSLIYNFRNNGKLSAADFHPLEELISGSVWLKGKKAVMSILDADTTQTIRNNRVYLKAWEGEISGQSIGNSVFSVFRYKLAENWLVPDLGTGLFELWYSNRETSDSVLSRILLAAVKNPDYNLPVTRVPVKLLISHAFEDAIGYLQDNLGASSFNWRWENVNQVRFLHPLETSGVQNGIAGFYFSAKRDAFNSFNHPILSDVRQKTGNTEITVFTWLPNEENRLSFETPSGIYGIPGTGLESYFLENWKKSNPVHLLPAVTSTAAFKLILHP